MANGIASELRNVLVFLNKHPRVRTSLAAPRDKTIVYSGDVNSVQGVFAAWKLLAQAKQQDPRNFDYVTLEERLRAFHVVEFGESLFDNANRVSNDLKRKGLAAVLELDDRSHDNPARQDADRRKAAICEAAGIPLHRLNVNPLPNESELQALIAPAPPPMRAQRLDHRRWGS